MSFIYGGDTGLTYEEMRKRREQSEQMRAISDKIAASQQTPTTFGGGLSAIGQALIARQKGKKADVLDAEADAAEKAGRSNASSVFQSILGGGAMSGQPQPASYTPEQGIADDAMAAIGKEPVKQYSTKFDFQMGPKRPEKPDQSVLDALGFTAEQVLGQGATVQIISGKGEHGSARHRGGHAADVKFVGPDGKVISLDDPRARELAFAASKNGITGFGAGKEYMGAETFHMDLYPVEQYTPDMGRAWGSFGNEIESEFIKHSQGNHSGHSHTPQGGVSQPKQQGVQVAQNGPGVEQIMAAMSNPYMSQEQKSALGILLQQKMQESDPMRQMQLEKGQLELQQMRQPANRPLPSGAAELEWRAKQAGLQPGSAEYQAFMLNGSGDPATFRALKLQALDAGFQEGTKEYADFMASRGAFEQSYSRQAGTNQAQVDSGRQASSAVAAGTVEGRMEAETQAAAGSDMRAGLNALDLLSSIRNDPSREIATGKSSVLGKIPGTGAYDFTKKVEQAKSGAFMTAIQQMRGMGALSNAEGQTARRKANNPARLILAAHP
jgi:hypothetical protein